MRIFSLLGMPAFMALMAALTAFPGTACAATSSGLAIHGIPFEFFLFALTLLGVAVFHHQTFRVALTGLTAIILYKLIFAGFATGTGLAGLAGQMGRDWVTLVNLFLLLLGFSILARHFEKSHVPVILPRYLPDNWTGAFGVLVVVWVISSFLDNIAAALIGGAMAHQLFRSKVHIGYVAAIVAASNAGGAFSVVGDTTTTMMWIAGVKPGQVFQAIIASIVALVIVGYVAAKQQHAYSPILKHAHQHTRVDWNRIFIVVLILGLAMATNITVNTHFRSVRDSFPFIGVAVWVAIALSIPIRRHDWEVLGENLKGTLFLLCLVTAASMMPVSSLPAASWHTAFGLGVVSAVFDNIPLTALAINQNGYDWGTLAFAVGFGGSMLWFASSAGVTISNMYPDAKSATLWLRHGWHVAVAYVVGFATVMYVLGWQSVWLH